MKKYWPIYLIVIIGFTIWLPLFKIFYLQDEWQGLGHILVEGIRHPIADASLIQVMTGSNRPLAKVVGYFLLGQFPMNSLPSSIFSMVFHLGNAVIVYFLAFKALKKKNFAFLAALFFLVVSNGANAVYWYSAAYGTLPATTFILLGINFFFDFLKNKISKSLLISFLMIYISLLFKDIGYFLLPFIPIYGFFVSGKKLKPAYLLFLLLFVAAFGVRMIQLKSVQGTAAFLKENQSSFSSSILIRAFYYPITSFSLQYFPPSQLLSISRDITRNYYPFILDNQVDLVSQTLVLDTMAIALSFIFFFIYYVFVRSETKERNIHLYFWILFSLLSFFPYVVITKNYSYLDSRYYYLSIASAAILFSWFVERMVISKKIVLIITAVILCSLYSVGNFKSLRDELDLQVKVSAERKSFIHQIRDIYSLSNKETKNVIYITSNQDYYVLGNKVPFQEGTGYTLMVMLDDKILVPQKFFTDHFLWDLGTQGYKETDSGGFGYFWDLKEMQKSIKTNHISKNLIKSFYYDSRTQTLKDISVEVDKNLY